MKLRYVIYPIVFLAPLVTVALATPAVIKLLSARMSDMVANVIGSGLGLLLYLCLTLFLVWLVAIIEQAEIWRHRLHSKP